MDENSGKTDIIHKEDCISNQLSKITESEVSCDTLTMFNIHTLYNSCPSYMSRKMGGTFEEPEFLNKLLGIYFQEWKSSPVFNEFITKEIYIIANKDNPDIVSEVEVLKVALHGKAPTFHRLEKLPSDPEDVRIFR